MSEFVEIVDCHGRRCRVRKGEILADGEKFSLPMQFMDSQLRDTLVEKYGGGAVRVVDAAGLPAGNKPGFLFDHSNVLADSAAEPAYRERVERPDATMRNRRAGLDDDDEHGGDGRHQEMDAGQMTLDELQARAESEYQKRCARMREAWRTRS
jgi:hypothetical protein